METDLPMILEIILQEDNINMGDIKLKNVPKINTMPQNSTVIVNDGVDIKQVQLENFMIDVGGSADSGWRVIHEEALTEAKNITIDGLDCTEVEAYIISTEAAEGMFYLTSEPTGTIYGEPRTRCAGKNIPFIMKLHLSAISSYLWEGEISCSNYLNGEPTGDDKLGYTHQIVGDIVNKEKINGITLIRDSGPIPVGTKIVIRGRNVKPDFLLTESGDVAYMAAIGKLEESPLTATAAHDIRIGTVAVTNEGIVTGEKNFPCYETSEGQTLIMPGMELKVQIAIDDCYDYTRLQAIVCAYNTSMTDSVEAKKVAIENSVYQVGSTDKLSSVTKEPETKTINFGLTNTGDIPLVIRYFTYREID